MGLLGGWGFLWFWCQQNGMSLPWALALLGLVLQDPFRMGYESVRTAVAHVRGQPYEKNVNTGVFLATPENMKDPRIVALLSPDLSAVNK